MKSVVFLPLLFGATLLAQPVEWDSTGNGLLTGQYRFREIRWQRSNADFNVLSEASGTYGTITFDGFGNYVIAAKRFDSGANQTTSLDFAGTYLISSSGFGFITRSNPNGGQLEGMVSNGVFIGSSTEKEINNLFIAARVGAPEMTTNAFNQQYTVAYTDVQLPGLNQTRNVLFPIRGDGVGGINNLVLSGNVAANPIGTNTAQLIPGSTYAFVGGVGTLNFNAIQGPNTLISGNKEVYVSADGSFIFGGSKTGWDMFVGVRTPTAPIQTSVFDYLYYQAGFEVERRGNGATFALDSFYGSLIPRGNIILAHQRILPASENKPFNFTYYEPVQLTNAGVQTDFQQYQHQLSADGQYRIGAGTEGFLGIIVALKAPVLTGPGVFLNPVGVVNAAGFTPFTTGISPGEVITLFGTGIAETVALDPTYPLTLNGVQVRINGKIAPVFKTSPGEVSVVVPYDIPLGIAEIQVTRNGSTSNRVTTYVQGVTPAIFTQPMNGLGYAAAQHAENFALITPQNPARPGKFIVLYLSGLGGVDQPVVAGAPGPVDPLARTPQKPRIRMSGIEAEVDYSGLAPFHGGLYQLNVKVPADLPAGDHFITVDGAATINNQAQIPVGTP